MRRYSFTWWLAVIPTSLVVGAPIFLWLGYETSWGLWERIAVALGCTIVVDLAVAGWIERTAPTKVRIGPGERETNGDSPADEALVLTGFGSSASGRVSVRGETWAAVRSTDDDGEIVVGTIVSIVDRAGLSLVVSTKRR